MRPVDVHSPSWGFLIALIRTRCVAQRGSSRLSFRAFQNETVTAQIRT
jgi:hypothetical protein